LCAPKITERRRVEVNEGIERAKEMGFQVMLATFTIPHGLGDDVDAIRKQMLQAWRRGTDTRAGKSMRKMIGLVGYIRVIEVTYGENGFHPHMHYLVNGSHSASVVSDLVGRLPQVRLG
jgi:ribosomal protein S5